jgi:phenylpropionate dioxygenase-like ring-hydroxylating dioxygenase large terminal subunit
MLFAKNTWYGAIWAKDLDRELTPRTYLNEPVLLYRKANGTPDRCCGSLPTSPRTP